MKLSDMTIEKTAERVDRIRQAAGDRFDDIELNWTIAVTVITDDRVATAGMALKALEQGYPPNIAHDTEFTVDDVLSSPYIAIGSFEEIADQIREVRRRTTMSYVGGVFPTQMDAFAPVLAQLKGGSRMTVCLAGEPRGGGSSTRGCASPSDVRFFFKAEHDDHNFFVG